MPTRIKTGPGARRIAWASLQQWEGGRAGADAIVDQRIRKELSGPDADLALEIFYGCIRWRSRLEFILNESSFKIGQHPLRCLLHTALYQLLFLDRVPAYAAVNETVEMAPDRARKLVNAFLRAFQREHAAWLQKIDSCRLDRPEIFYSHPSWLIRRWRLAFGEARTRALLEWNNSVPPVFIRVNTLRSSAAGLADLLAPHRPKPGPHPGTLQIESPGGLFSSGAFAEGAFYAQDPSTLYAPDLLAPQPGQAVLDACSAPGGKTTYIAQLMQNQGRIVAADADARRLRLVKQNSLRLGTSIIEIRERPLAASESFDRILLDVPCSNTGVMRRRVDLRWRLRQNDIAELARRQVELCLAHWRRLKPGGALVYSTCSIEREENEDVVARVLAQCGKKLRLVSTWSSFPPESGMDGGFAARFELA